MPTTLADHLRSLSDDALGALLKQRPDLVVPVPADLSALAIRAQSRVSVARALDRLDEFTLRILDAARLTRDAETGTTSVEAVLSLADGPNAGAPNAGAPNTGGPNPRGAGTGGPNASGPNTGGSPAARALNRLRELFLLYGPDTALRLAAGVEEACPPYPAGLGRPASELDPAAAALCADPARLRRTLLSAPPAARAVLDRLAAGPPVGTVAAGTTGPGTTGTGAAAEPTAPARNGAAARGTGDPRDAAGAGAGETDGGKTDGGKTDGGKTDGAGADGGADNPVRWLVEHRLLVPITPAGNGHGAVEMPRELGLLLRRDTGPLGPLRPTPPPIDAPTRKPRTVDSAGAGQAMEVVRQAEALLEVLSADPAPILRTGGVGGRDLRRVARAAGVDEQLAPLLLEIVYAAGLAGEAEAAGRDRVGRAAPTSHLLPTMTYDGWRAASLARRWSHLAGTWLAMTRQPGLVGQRDARDRPVNALAPEAERAGAPATRCAVLGALYDLPPGTAPTADALLALLAWRQPRRAASREPMAREALDEAARLGVTGLSALTSFGRLLLTPEADDGGQSSAARDPLGVRVDLDVRGDLGLRVDEETGAPAAARMLDTLLPAPVDHVLVQADLTVVVPGPPEPELAAELDLIAEPESAGGALVYRLTPDSVRRGLDAGYPADDLHRLFKRRSRTPVPQALTYLIDDVARKHGGLRSGSAGAYLRSDDEALLAEVLADRRLVPLALRRLAPTVLVSPYQSSRLLAGLRDAGYAPVPEDAAGAAVLTRPRARRAGTRGTTPTRITDPLAPPTLTEPRVLGIVEQIRRGDAVARAARRAPVTVRAGNGHGADRLTSVQAHTQALTVLQQAVRDRALVWVGYVDAHGAATSRLVRPVSMGGGYLRAEDERTDTLHTFALHRVTAAVLDG